MALSSNSMSQRTQQLYSSLSSSIKERVSQSLNQISNNACFEVGVISTLGGNWDKLSSSQKMRKIAGRVQALTKGLPGLELMQMTTNNCEITPQIQKLVEVMWCCDKPNATNRTFPELVQTVANRVQCNQPIEFFASVCLEKGPGFREAKLNWFLKGQRLSSPIESFIGKASLNGLSNIEKLLQRVEYPH